MRQPPLDMGDIFVVDDGDLGISVKRKGSKTFQEIIGMWPQEKKIGIAYSDFETVTFFNGKGALALTEWLNYRRLVTAG